MPSFTNQVANLRQSGPVVEVFIGPAQSLVQALKSKNQPAPSPVRAVAMIDTGASGTVITPSLAQSLGIQPVGLAQMSTPSTHAPVQVPAYNISLTLPNNVVVGSAIATAAPLGGQHIQCLIGRDILEHGVLVYIGYLRQFTLSF